MPIEVACRLQGMDSTGDQKDEEPLTKRPYWISVSARSKFRRLHRTGGCWYTAGHMEYITHPKGHRYDASCDRCFPNAAADKLNFPEVAGASSSVDTSDESSSTADS